MAVDGGKRMMKRNKLEKSGGRRAWLRLSSIVVVVVLAKKKGVIGKNI